MSEIKEKWIALLKELVKIKYQFQFSWLGFPVFQMPQDLIAYQKIIYDLKPNLIIETGVAQGGSSIFFASMLQLCGIDGKVIGVDINLREIIKQKVNNHPLGKAIMLIKTSSVEPRTINRIHRLSRGKKVLVCLDSNHSYRHVLAELRAYSPIANYIIVNDTGMENLGIDNSPMKAVREFLKENNNFVLDDIDKRIVMTGHPNGYLRRVK